MPLREDTALWLSIAFYANNEVGTINLIAEIGAELRKRRCVVFHVDAARTGFTSVDVKAPRFDLFIGA